MAQSIEVMGAEAMSKPWKEAQESVSEQVGLGVPLSEAMGNYPRFFPGMVRRLVRVGEEGNILPAMLKAAGRNLQSAREVQIRLRKCLVYPFFVWTILLANLAAMFTYGIPKLLDFYNSAGAELPAQTRVFIDIGPVLMIVGCGLFFYLAWLLIGFIGSDLEQRSTQSVLAERIICYIPMLSTLHLHARAAQVCDMLGALLGAGHSTQDAVNIARGAVDSPSLQKALEDIDAAITVGHDYQPATEPTLIPQATLWMLAQTGGAVELGTSLQNLSAYHWRELDVHSNMVREILEPLLLIIVAILGGFAIVSLYLPLLSIVNAVL